MYAKFIAMCMGGLIFSTGLWAAQVGGNPTPNQKQQLESMKKIHHYNNVFDSPSHGGIPYENYKNMEKKK